MEPEKFRICLIPNSKTNKANFEFPLICQPFYFGGFKIYYKK